MVVSRRLVARVGLALLVAVCAVAPVRVAAVAAVSATDEAGALSLAAESGAAVVVGSSVTETSRVVARPDGTLALEAFSVPVRVRVRRGGEWVGVDTSLVSVEGGWSPRASSVGLVLSGGGSGPAVVVTQGGVQVSWSWPGRLPAPVVDGDTATYREVWSGSIFVFVLRRVVFPRRWW